MICLFIRSPFHFFLNRIFHNYFLGQRTLKSRIQRRSQFIDNFFPRFYLLFIQLSNINAYPLHLFMYETVRMADSHIQFTSLRLLFPLHVFILADILLDLFTNRLSLLLYEIIHFERLNLNS